MDTSLSLLFYLKKPKNYLSGPQPIYMRITVAGPPKELSIGRDCEPSKWNKILGKMNGRDEAVKTLNSYIDTLRIKIENIHLKLLRSESEVTAEAIRNTFLGVKAEAKKLMEVFREHNDKVEALIGNGFTKGTLTKYRTTEKHLVAFMRTVYKVSDIDIRKIEYSFVTDFDFYLRSKCGCANNSAIKHLKCLSKIMRECLAKKWITHNPFEGHKNRLQKVERVKLSEKELSLLYAKDIANPRIEQVRDVFLFCCYTGLSFIDVQKLAPSHIRVGADGHQWIITKREKTSVAAHIPLLPIALEILEKYDGHPICEDKGRILPVSSNQKMNAYLKEIGDFCDIPKEITFHMARHTFATTVTLTNGVPIETVSKMLGHKNLHTTQHYAKVLDVNIMEDMEKLKSKFR